jgi:hypothetical protein
VGYDRHDMTTCAKCGTENVAGDAFCGTCGAFLEFAAEEAAEDAQAGAPAEAAPANPPPPAPSPVAVPVPAGAMPAAATPAAPAPSAASGPTCSACGRVNPAGRRFCISCGDRLPVGSTTLAQGPGSEMPPPAGSAKPAWEFPTASVPTAGLPAAAGAPVAPAVSAAPASGGGSRLPLIGGALVVLVVLAGGAVLVLGGGLGGGTPGTTASAPPSSALASASPGTEPSAEPTAPPETPAASEAPSIPPEPTVPAATVPPGPSVGIAITAAKASSQLAANRAPKYLYDGSPVTAWKSKTGRLDGSWVEISFAPAAVTKIQVWAGWQKGEPLFYGNHRPRNVTVAFDGGVPVPLEFKDAFGAQGVAIPPELGIVAATRLRIAIIDTYPSRKTSAGGSPSKEVAISEIRVFGVPAAP